MARERENITAGLFVLAGVALALVVVFTLSDFNRLFEKKQTVKVSYRVADGLAGLKSGATVTLGDQPIGEVTGIKDSADPAGRVTEQVVSFKIPARYRIFQDAVVELNTPPLGSGTKLNIKSVGGNRPAYDGTPIPGGKAGSPLMEDLMAKAGIRDEERQHIRETLANLADLSAALSDNELRYRSDVRPGDKRGEPVRLALRKLSEAVRDLPALVNKAQDALDKARNVMANLEDSTGRLREAAPGVIDNVKAVSKKADESLTIVRDFLKDENPKLRSTVENVQEISEHAKTTTMAKLDDALEHARVSMENVRKSSEELRAFVTGQRPVLERMFANLQLSSDQLKLATIEVRRSPWRLLYTPGEKELNTDNLYDAARSFALAAGSLDSATQSLRAVAHEDAGDKEKIGRMVEHLGALFQRFEEAEARFWKALKASPGPGTPSR
jgi:ABC-type transporter Mla subunit MlaD